VLQQLQENLRFFEDRGVAVLAVNTQGDSPEVIREVLNDAGVDYQVCLDSAQQAYSALGLYVMPAVLIVDRNGRISSGIGYRRNLIESLKGEVQIIAGEKSREEILAAFYPAMAPKSENEKKAHLRFNQGVRLREQGMPSAAIREFQEAVRYNPGMGKAYSELGCLYLQQGRMQEAEGLLDKGLELDSSAVNGHICKAELRAARGEVEEALDNLEALRLQHRRNAEIRYMMGILHEKNGDLEQASGEYRKAYELLLEKMGAGS
jgi:tetratricopeptide (TPR) repeat protein